MATDPFDAASLSNFARTPEEREEFLVFSVLVANKPAAITTRKLVHLLDILPYKPFYGGTILERIQYAVILGQLDDLLRQVRTGQYSRIRSALTALACIQLDLAVCTVEDLEAIPGIGPKTARFFLLHSRPNQRLAALDTHVLKWLRSRGFFAPRSTPPAGPQYRTWEEIFLQECDKLAMSPSEVDFAVWLTYAHGVHERPRPRAGLPININGPPETCAPGSLRPRQR